MKPKPVVPPYTLHNVIAWGLQAHYPKTETQKHPQIAKIITIKEEEFSADKATVF